MKKLISFLALATLVAPGFAQNIAYRKCRNYRRHEFHRHHRCGGLGDQDRSGRSSE
ncbi:MAG: hypothetical protein IPG92_16405 [Flavobacteriales bacterium]|nr:hypothetical protein [Flavobacteriales bacterium]